VLSDARSRRAARRAGRRLRAARGAISLEYLGVTLAAAAITIAIAAGTPQIRAAISDLMAEVVCALSGPDCVVDSGAEGEGPFTARVPTDTDSDGLPDAEERRLGLAWGDADSDDDGLGDYLEVNGRSDAFISGRTDPKDPDSDDDGVSDGEELRLSAEHEGGYAFDPLVADADRDGMNDAQELALGTRPDDEFTESEGGGFETLSDLEEVFTYGTDPNSVDTDGDGEWDDWEIRDGTNPLVDERSGVEKLLEGLEDFVLGDPIGTIAGGGAGAAAKLGGKGLKRFADEIAQTGAKGADDVARRLDDAATRLDEATAAGGGAGRVPVTAAQADTKLRLEEAARRAVEQTKHETGLASGPVFGTKAHTAFRQEVQRLGLASEVTYLRGRTFAQYKKDSIRADAVLGPDDAPQAIFDLKTGSARLTEGRIARIRDHLPDGFDDIPIIEIRP
jgi:hypothetical protein